MQAQAAESSGYAGPFCCSLQEETLKTGCSESSIVKQALEQTRQRLFESFLTRNELVASAFA